MDMTTLQLANNKDATGYKLRTVAACKTFSKCTNSWRFWSELFTRIWTEHRSLCCFINELEDRMPEYRQKSCPSRTVKLGSLDDFNPNLCPRLACIDYLISRRMGTY